MITDSTKWHYLALKSEPKFYGGKLCNRPVKNLSRLLRGIRSNHHGDFYCLNCHCLLIKNMKNYVINMIAVVYKCLSSLKKY